MDDGQAAKLALPEITKPPPKWEFASLAALYALYVDTFVRREFFCPRGIRVLFEKRHFFHLVKLGKGTQIEFDIEVEEPLILAVTNGLGEYRINEKRASTLSWLPEIIEKPHEIWEYEIKKTGDEVFIREYDKAGSPFRNFIALREKDYLTPVTCMTVRRTGIKEHRRGKKLYPI